MNDIIVRLLNRNIYLKFPFPKMLAPLTDEHT